MTSFNPIGELGGSCRSALARSIALSSRRAWVSSSVQARRHLLTAYDRLLCLVALAGVGLAIAATSQRKRLCHLDCGGA